MIKQRVKRAKQKNKNQNNERQIKNISGYQESAVFIIGYNGGYKYRQNGYIEQSDLKIIRISGKIRKKNQGRNKKHRRKKQGSHYI